MRTISYCELLNLVARATQRGPFRSSCKVAAAHGASRLFKEQPGKRDLMLHLEASYLAASALLFCTQRLGLCGNVSTRQEPELNGQFDANANSCCFGRGSRAANIVRTPAQKPHRMLKLPPSLCRTSLIARFQRWHHITYSLLLCAGGTLRPANALVGQPCPNRLLFRCRRRNPLTMCCRAGVD
jgi:hypothetical protein